MVRTHFPLLVSAPELLRPTTLREVAGSPGPCITILLPAGEFGKSSVPAAAQQLAQRGFPRAASAHLLTPLEQLSEDPTFTSGCPWSRVILASFSAFHQFYLTQPVKAQLIVGGSFSIRQLVAEADRPRVFYVLGVTGNRVALLRCGGLRSEIVKLPAGVPDGGVENRSDFYKLVDRGLQQLLHEPCTPLILAGLEEDIALYRVVSAYRDLMRESIPGFAGMALEQTEIWQKAYSIVCSDQHRRRAAELLAAKERTPRGRLSTDVDTILHAAFEGRVSQLYVNERAERIDMFERGSYQSWGSEDLYNLAAAQTILHQGKACFLPANLMPDRATAAAILRF